jgi:hypothetical protein
MDEQKTPKLTIDESIDACRAGHDDLRLPELAELAQAVSQDSIVAERLRRVQLCDRALGGAMQDVEIPTGLSSRILGRLQVSQVAPSVNVATVALPEGGEPKKSARQNRRRLAWILALAASLLICGSLTIAWVAKPQGPMDVVTLADNWRTELTAEWRPISALPKSLSMPAGIAARPRTWQPIPRQLGYQGAAFDLSRPGCKAVLFVVDVIPNKQFPLAPPFPPQFSSGGRTVAAWMLGKRLCVLVVDGDERDYRSLVHAGQAPLA